MRALRSILIAVLGLLASAPWLVAEEPQPGKVRLVRALHSSRDTDRVLGFSADGRRLLTAGINVIAVWDVKSGQKVARFTREGRFTDPAAFFLPDGKTLANAYHRTQLWEVGTGKLRHEFDAATRTICFSPERGLLAAAVSLNPKAPWHVHLWDWRDPSLEQPKALSPQDIDRLWTELASADAGVGYRAIASLLAHPGLAVTALEKRLKHVEPVTPTEIDRLISNLDADSFLVRQRASERLAALGESARGALLRIKAQQLSPEVRRRVENLLAHPSLPIPTDQLRCLRAVEVLEAIGTAEARHAIRKLASEASGTVETDDAKAALDRLKHR